jgi:hypothetical protein
MRTRPRAVGGCFSLTGHLPTGPAPDAQRRKNTSGESACRYVPQVSDLHTQEHVGWEVAGICAQRQGLPLQRIHLGVQRGYVLTLRHVLR